MQQLALAEQMIAGGAARHALLVQSAATTRYMRTEDPMSAWFGDGATAVVVGPVREGFGILGRCHETHGVYYEGLVCGIPDKRWHEGSAHAYIVRPELSRRLLLETVERSAAVVGAALAEAGFAQKDVDFYASHQGFAWLRKVTQTLTGLDHAKTLDTFPWAGSMLGSNIPLVLSVAEHEGVLAAGDLVASFSGAAGATLASLVFRWGGRA
jgi:3-oxoacyl-[acyl-carrier-protein] synthase III